MDHVAGDVTAVPSEASTVEAASAPSLPPGITIVPMYPLYSVGQIFGATLLGGPLATAWLMAVNYRRLGAPKKAMAREELSIRRSS